MQTSRLVELSDALHERVQRFALAASQDTFEGLALDIARFQAEASAGFGRLLASTGRSLHQLADIPAVPSAAFRLTRVATLPPELDTLRFHTSGTTGSERGTHAMRRRDSYERLSLRFGARALLPQGVPAAGAAVVVALAPPLGDPPKSSLGYMMARFMEAFDGAPLGTARFDVTASDRWLLGDRGVDLPGLVRASEVARTRRKPLLVLGTAFALVRLLDDLQGRPLPLPVGSAVMQTGGFKGRTREVSMAELRAGLGQALTLAPERVVGEYGMTELTSQLYEATLRESELGQAQPGAVSGIYYEPSTLRVTPVDPVSLLPVAEGQPGLARFVDLGNVDSAVCVVTQDLVRRSQGGVELLGRQPGATPRGCSLAIEALLGG